jgi:hypothetical protein
MLNHTSVGLKAFVSCFNYYIIENSTLLFYVYFSFLFYHFGFYLMLILKICLWISLSGGIIYSAENFLVLYLARNKIIEACFKKVFKNSI